MLKFSLVEWMMQGIYLKIFQKYRGKVYVKQNYQNVVNFWSWVMSSRGVIILYALYICIFLSVPTIMSSKFSMSRIVCELTPEDAETIRPPIPKNWSSSWGTWSIKAISIKHLQWELRKQPILFSLNSA